MKSRERKRKKGEAFLISVAESIGSTMGTIVGRANAAQKAVTQSPVARTVKREGKKLVGKSKKAKTTMPADLKRRKQISRFDSFMMLLTEEVWRTRFLREVR